MEGFILYVILFIVGLITGGSVMFLAARKMIAEAPQKQQQLSSNNCNCASTTSNTTAVVVTQLPANACPVPVQYRTCTSDQINSIKAYMKGKEHDKQMKNIEYDILNNSGILPNVASQMCAKGMRNCPIDHTQCCSKEEYESQLKAISQTPTSSGPLSSIKEKLDSAKNTFADIKSQASQVTDAFKNFNVGTY